MATLPKFEGEIVLSTNTTLGTFAGSVITIPLGNYFLGSVGNGGATRSLIAEIQNQLRVTTADVTWTVTIDDASDTSGGKVTIARSTGYTATWTSTTLRDVLGFTGNLTPSATTFTGANHARFLFLPNCGRSNVLAPQASTGHIVRDHSIAVAPDGTVYSIAYSSRRIDTLAFRTLKGTKTWNSLATTTNEALEQFYTDVIGAPLRVRFYAVRSDNATYRTWYVEDAGHFDPQPLKDNWLGSQALFQIAYRVLETT